MIVQISIAGITDVPELRSLAERAFVAAYARFNTEENMQQYLAEHFSEEQIRKEVSDSTLIHLIARNPQLAGFAKLLPDAVKESVKGKSIEILRLYTAPELTGKGIGKMMIQEIAELGCKRGYEWICLDVWQKNTEAIRFYEREGFVITGTTSFRLGDDVQDDFVMAKKI